MGRITFEQIAQNKLNESKADNKKKLQNKGENALYAKLRKQFPDGMVFGLMKIKDYVEMLKVELQQEQAEEKQ